MADVSGRIGCVASAYELYYIAASHVLSSYFVYCLALRFGDFLLHSNQSQFHRWYAASTRLTVVNPLASV